MRIVFPEPAGDESHTTGLARARSRREKRRFRGKTSLITGLLILAKENFAMPTPNITRPVKSEHVQFGK